jgi:hypothetical protein
MFVSSQMVDFGPMFTVNPLVIEDQRHAEVAQSAKTEDPVRDIKRSSPKNTAISRPVSTRDSSQSRRDVKDDGWILRKVRCALSLNRDDLCEELWSIYTALEMVVKQLNEQTEKLNKTLSDCAHLRLLAKTRKAFRDEQESRCVRLTYINNQLNKRVVIADSKVERMQAVITVERKKRAAQFAENARLSAEINFLKERLAAQPGV